MMQPLSREPIQSDRIAYPFSMVFKRYLIQIGRTFAQFNIIE